MKGGERSQHGAAIEVHEGCAEKQHLCAQLGLRLREWHEQPNFQAV